MSSWARPELAGWDIVGMNHYSIDGERRLFVAMVKGDRWIRAEGDDEKVFDQLALEAVRAAPTSPSEPAAKIDPEQITRDWLKHLGWLDPEIEWGFAERDHGECGPTPEGWDCTDGDGDPLHPLHDEVDDIAALVMFVLERLPSVSVEPVPPTPPVPGSTERPEGILAELLRIAASPDAPPDRLLHAVDQAAPGRFGFGVHDSEACRGSVPCRRRRAGRAPWRPCVRGGPTMPTDSKGGS